MSANWKPEDILPGSPLTPLMLRRSPRFLSDQDREDIRTWYHQGHPSYGRTLTPDEIASLKGVVVSCVSRHLREYRKVQKRPPLTDEQIELAIGMRQLGHTWIQIGGKIQRDPGSACNAVTRWCKRYGRELP